MLGRISLVLLALAAVCCQRETAAEEGSTVVSGGHTFVLGTKTYSIPTPPRPEKGQLTRDPTFSTPFVRLTDKAKDGYTDDGVVNEYARSDPENADGSLVILRGLSGDWHIYRTRDHRRLGGFKNPAGQQMEPRWDPKDPHLFYFVADMKLWSFNAQSRKQTAIRDFKRDFPHGLVITSRTEGDASVDRRYFCWQVQDDKWETTDVFVYDRVQNLIVGRKALRKGIDWVSMSMSGKHCLIGYDSERMQAYTRDLKRYVTMPAGAGHMDLALTAEGRDVMVYQSNKTDYISMADLETGQETSLLALPFKVNPAIGLHVSGNSSSKVPGWVLISTSGPKNPPAGKRHSWMDLQLFMMELKARPRVWRLVATHSVDQINFKDGDGNRQYFAEAFASINTRGNRVYWGSNWESSQLARLETYVAHLPDGWPGLIAKGAGR
jgi:hypothetical protein